MLGVQTQLLLYAAGLEPIFWCFTLLHAATLSNIQPCSDGRPSPHVELFKTPPNLTSLHIFGSPLYCVDRCVTHHCLDLATKKGMWLSLRGMAEMCVYMDTLTKMFRYCHHYIVHKLDLNKLPGDWAVIDILPQRKSQKLWKYPRQPENEEIVRETIRNEQQQQHEEL
jgi:hypothetical protein